MRAEVEEIQEWQIDRAVAALLYDLKLKFSNGVVYSTDIKPLLTRCCSGLSFSPETLTSIIEKTAEEWECVNSLINAYKEYCESHGKMRINNGKVYNARAYS